MSFDDPFANIEPANTPSKPSKPRATRKDKFDQPLTLTRRDAYKATGTGTSAVHGRFYQLTTRVPFEMMDALREWAAYLGTSQQDLQRYCFYRGMQALQQGERPEFEEVVIKKRLKMPE